MAAKILIPKLRSVVGGMGLLLLILLWTMHRDAKREIANQKGAGLGAVAVGWDPISLWQQSSFSSYSRPRTKRGVAGGVVGGVPGRDRDKLIESARISAQLVEPLSSSEDHKVVQTVGLELLVKNASDTAAEIERVTRSLHGEIEKADLHNYGNSREGELTLRVPTVSLDDSVAQFSRQAIRVQDQHREARDITREFMDNEAHLRNMKAEEQQYLVLLRRAGSMKDTLEVTDKLSEVRGEIEQLQGELNWWSHQVSMSAVQIHLTEEPQANLVARWRPFYNAKNSAVLMLHDLGDWVDWVVALVINIPVILVWFVTVGGLLLLGWKVLRWAWFRFFRPAPPVLPTAA
ncbi:MAG TPA: DUF4349 domain-containing protein [Terriglobales bacterium]|nr:DUF4349 domain-containing protein [Terriglobales bacterium]